MGLAIGWSNASIRDDEDPAETAKREYDRQLMGYLLVGLNGIVFVMGMWTMLMCSEKIKEAWDKVKGILCKFCPCLKRCACCGKKKKDDDDEDDDDEDKDDDDAKGDGKDGTDGDKDNADERVYGAGEGDVYVDSTGVRQLPKKNDVSLSGAACTKCGANLPDKAKFCFDCGTQCGGNASGVDAVATRACKECGADLPEKAKFCFDCGARSGKSGGVRRGRSRRRMSLVKAAMSAIDVDGDGELDFDEFAAVCKAEGDAARATCNQLFLMLDVDGGGTVDADEISDVLRKNREARELAKQFDAIQDFVDMVGKKKARMSPQQKADRKKRVAAKRRKRRGSVRKRRGSVGGRARATPSEEALDAIVEGDGGGSTARQQQQQHQQQQQRQQQGGSSTTSHWGRARTVRKALAFSRRQSAPSGAAPPAMFAGAAHAMTGGPPIGSGGNDLKAKLLAARNRRAGGTGNVRRVSLGDATKTSATVRKLPMQSAPGPPAQQAALAPRPFTKSVGDQCEGLTEDGEWKPGRIQEIDLDDGALQP